MDQKATEYNFLKKLAKKEDDFKLTSYTLFDIGAILDKRLHDAGVKQESVLEIYLDDERFKKMDEDLFYRNNPKEDKFIPSDNEIVVNFVNLKVRIIKKNEVKK
jgi:hypothetical protein